MVNVVGATKEVNLSLYFTYGVKGVGDTTLEERNVGLSNELGREFKSGQ